MNFSTEGFKCGLEIHQRLDTRKLFSHAYSNPSKELEKEKVIKVTRLLTRATGESGVLDESAHFEAAKKQTFTYIVGSKTSSLVELDEEPPHEISQEALKVVLQVAKTCKAQILPVIQVMRKTIIDGSATSGFQRTMLIAIGGEIQTPQGYVRLQTICLEEESAGIIEKKTQNSTYALDRLGIPLIEIATKPDIKNPKHAFETALAIGEFLRSSGKMQRGIGTIRQDLNVSVTGGARCEVKGAQELNEIEKLVENEANRQKRLIEIKSKIKLPAKIQSEARDLTSVFTSTNCKFIAKSISIGAKVYGVKLPGLKGVLGFELASNYRVGSEISDFLKATCGDGILHADEQLEKYSISQKEVHEVKQKLAVKEEDSFMLTVSLNAKQTLAFALERLLQLSKEVPQDTRRAEGEITRFMRPISGAARLYPETDCPLIKISKESLNSISAIETPLEKQKKFEEMGLNLQLANRMAKDSQAQDFETLAKIADPQVVATTLLDTLTALRRLGKDTNALTYARLQEALNAYTTGLVNKQALAILIEKMCSSNKTAVTLIKENNLRKITSKTTLREVILTNNYDVGKIMQKYRLNVDSMQLQKEIKELKR